MYVWWCFKKGLPSRSSNLCGLGESLRLASVVKALSWKKGGPRLKIRLCLCSKEKKMRIEREPLLLQITNVNSNYSTTLTPIQKLFKNFNA